MCTEPDYNFFLRLLQEQKVQLQELIDNVRDNARPVELDQTKVGRLSRMDAMQSQAMAKETQRRRKTDITRIDAAIKRIKDADYGFCCVCGELIPKNGWTLILLRQHAFNALKHTRGRIKIVYDTL